MQIVMLVYNNCTTDQRVLKEAASLREAGHEVTVLAVLDRTTLPAEERHGIRILRIDRRPLHYRLLWAVRRIRYLIRWPVLAVLERVVRVRQLAALRALRSRAPGGDPVAVGNTPTSSPLAVRLIRALGAPSRVAGRLAHRNLMRLHKPLMYLDWYWRAFGVARGLPVDAVHAHDLNTLPAAVAIARAARAELVYDAHELYPEVSTLSKLESRVWRRLEPRLIRRADQVITVCGSIGEELVRRYGIAPPHILLNCPVTNGWELGGDRSLLRRRAGIESGSEPIVLYQGGFVPNRGLEALVRSASLLHRGVIVLMGWGRLEPELVAIVERERLADRVRIVAPVGHQELARYTAGADVGVIPYEPVGLNNYFTTPNKLFEYIAVGLPVVASALPELRKVLHGHRVGVTFQRVEAGEIAAALNSVLDDAALLAELRANALAIRGDYTWENEALKLVQIYGATRSPTVNARRR